MTIETATYISDLNSTLPAAGDLKSEGDDHIRLVKSTVKTTFPNVTGAVTPTHTVINNIAAGTFPAVALSGITGGTYSGTHTYSGTVMLGSNEAGYRVIPRNTAYGQLGQCSAISADITVSTGDAAGSVYMIYNNSAAAINLVQGGGLTMRLAGTTTTGSRVLAARGMATIWFNSTTEVVVSGAGVT